MSKYIVHVAQDDRPNSSNNQFINNIVVSYLFFNLNLVYSSTDIGHLNALRIRPQSSFKSQI